MEAFFSVQNADMTPYAGLVLLNKDKVVFDAYSIKADNDVEKIIGNNYAGIEFKGNEGSLHKVLTLYRAGKDHPMGKRCLEIAFEVKRDGNLLGWLIFQIDEDQLKRVYRINEEELREFRFNEF